MKIDESELSDEWRTVLADLYIAGRKGDKATETLHTTADRVKALLADAEAKGAREILERVCCCDNEPVRTDVEDINVCDGKHLTELAALTQTKGEK